MNDLLQTGLFNLLFESSQGITNSEMRNGSGNFREQAGMVSPSESTYPEIYRMLNINYKK